ncbi:MAG: LTA synthase family protein [Bacteroidales bacterium]|nr:LTA synthase family protein [Candidatus Colimorpha merdihippi]
MRNKRNFWLNTSNIYLYLLFKTLLALLVLFASQLFFYYYNTRIFHVDGFGEWMGVLLGNLTFGIATVGFMLLPYYAANLIPFHFRWNKHYHHITEIFFFYVPILFILITNICDAAYFQFTYRRLSGEIFRYLGIGGNMGTLWPKFLHDYWPATVFGCIIIPLVFLIGTRLRLAVRNRYRKHTLNDIIGLVIGAACVLFLFRGGFGKNLEWRDTAKYCQAKNCALVTNSGYNIVRTFNGGTLEDESFMSDSKALQLFNPVFAADSTAIPEAYAGWAPGAGRWDEFDTVQGSYSFGLLQPRYSNVVVIVLESFSQEYMGCYNSQAKTSFTPFLDSLSRHSVVYQGRANGKKSIEGIPSIFASLPTLMTFPLTLSDYFSDTCYALPSILRDHNYHTAFFHGSYNGVMAFDKLCNKLGFQEYYGQNEYMTDPYARESDYDGCWGIYDEYYLQYMVRKLSTFKEPFMAGVFTLSSHHPYTMQPGHEHDFVEGKHPICRVVMYSDNALRKFFDAARHTDWYKNTLFVITADHPGQGLTPEYNGYSGWYRIPMMFYLPRYEECLVPEMGKEWSTAQVSQRLMQQTDIMPTILEYLGIATPAVCFGTSALSNAYGWQIAYGNGYYQLETSDGVAVLGQEKEEIIGKGNMPLLKSIIQQYNHRMIDNQLVIQK